jgi:hypothetical protein
MQKIPRLPAAEQSLAPASRASEHLPAAIGHNGGRPLHEDLLDGAEEIAVEMFGSSKHRRRVYHLAETGQIPVFRLGSKICARKSVLRARIAQQEAESLGARA